MVFRNSLLLRQLLQLLVACAAVTPIAVTTATKVSDYEEPPATKALIDWIRKRGGFYNPKQIAVATTSDGRRTGIHAAEDIEHGEVLLEVPWEIGRAHV